MTGKSISILLVVVLLGTAGIWWFVSGSATESGSVEVSDTQEEVDSMESTTGANPAGTGALAELFLSGQPLECQFTFVDEGYVGEGVSYMDGEQMRMSAAIQQNGTSMTSDYILTGNTMYMWAETLEGFFAVSMPAGEESGMMDDEDDFLSMDDEVTYECQPWSVDASVFVPPTDVEFMDMGAMMQGMMEGFEGMSQAEIEAMMQGMMQ